MKTQLFLSIHGINYKLTRIPKFAKNENSKFEIRTNIQYHNSIEKQTKPQSLASLTLKDNPKQLYEIHQPFDSQNLFFNLETTYERLDQRKELLIRIELKPKP